MYKFQINPFLFVVLLNIFISFSCNNSNKGDNKLEIKDDNSSFWPSIRTKLKIDTFNINISIPEFDFDADRLAQVLMDSLPKVIIDCNPYWVVENDLLMDKSDLFYYCQSKLRLVDTSAKVESFAALTIGTTPELGGIDPILRWPEGQEISFSVLENSFAKNANYKIVVRRLKEAVQQWMEICNVKFVYKPEYDSLSSNATLPKELTFFVVEKPIYPMAAASFYPFDPPERRRLYLDSKLYYFGPYDSIGTIRHELGHILGFRHEMLWSRDSRCGNEQVVINFLGKQLGARLINDKYDSLSVMHYKCGTKGSYNLNFSETDKNSASFVYGPPIK